MNGVQHFVAEPDSDFDPQLERRQAVRLLLLDGAGRVLLLRHVPPLHDVHWAGCGGGLESGELAMDALIREANEELGLRVPHSAPQPCGEWRHSYRYRGRMVVQHEYLSCMPVPASYQPELGPAAATDGIDRIRWFTAEQVQGCSENVWPDGLFEWLKKLSARHA